ncbi:MAG: hypothetical protein PHH28_04800 [Desulfuromonadaceae bacterium]|nr:hypothetical protein [Desulfuromonadaceae bacterium]
MQKIDEYIIDKIANSWLFRTVKWSFIETLIFNIVWIAWMTFWAWYLWDIWPDHAWKPWERVVCEVIGLSLAFVAALFVRGAGYVGSSKANFYIKNGQ